MSRVDLGQKVQLRSALLAVLSSSTAMPFRRLGNKYRCFYCNSNFQQALELREHTRTDHSNINYRKVKGVYGPLIKFDITDLSCKLCFQELENIQNLIEHLNQKHAKRLSKIVLECIMSFRLSDDVLKCLICGEQFSFFGPLLIHTHRSHMSKQFICEECGAGFASSSGILRHTQSVHPKTSFSCRHCDKKFSTTRHRDDHEKRIHNTENRKCHVCSEVLGSVYKRDTHLELVHNIWRTVFKCPKCPKAFRFKSHLNNHNRRVHLKEKKTVCNICGDRFFNNSFLKLHLIRHSDAKPFECEYCKKKFARKQGLDIHTRIHTNDKRCVCKECGKAFVQTASLKLHIRVHHKNSTASVASSS